MEYIIKSILAYLNATNISGAFQITGKWGCGKTYFVKNILSQETELIQVAISMFGVNSVKEIPYRLLNAYINKMKDAGKDVTESMNRGLDYFDFKYGTIKNFMDINLHDESELIYRIIPNDKVYLCFDDVERFLNETNVEEFMGTINSLVENNSYRVILITNDNYIDQSNSNKTFALFKEKVVMNSISYSVRFHEVYGEMVKEYEDDKFSSYMDSDVYPNIFSVKKIRNEFRNIRNFKFTLMKFYPVFRYYKENLDDDLTKKKLNAFLTFMTGVSLEYKLGHLSETDNHGIDKYTEIFNLNLDDELSEDNVVGLFNEVSETPEEKNNREKKDRENTIYSNRFYNNYIKSFGQKAIFYEQLYDNIVKGKPINYDALDKTYEEQVTSKEISENTGNKLVQQTLNGSFFDYSDEEAKGKMNEILSAAEKSTLDQCLTYINAFSFLDFYKSVICIDHKELESKFQKGIDGYVTRRDISQMEKSGIDMVKGNIPQGTRNLYDYLLTRIDEKWKSEREKGVEEMVHLFETDINAFANLFGETQTNGSFRYNTEPVLQYIPQDIIEKRIQTVNAKDVHSLAVFISQRYRPEDIYSFHLKEEKTFLTNLLKSIESIEGDDTITKVEIKTVLKFHIEKALRYIGIS